MFSIFENKAVHVTGQKILSSSAVSGGWFISYFKKMGTVRSGLVLWNALLRFGGSPPRPSETAAKALKKKCWTCAWCFFCSGSYLKDFQGVECVQDIWVTYMGGVIVWVRQKLVSHRGRGFRTSSDPSPQKSVVGGQRIPKLRQLFLATTEVTRRYIVLVVLLNRKFTQE